MEHPLDHIGIWDASKMTGISTEGLRARIKRGEIPVVRVGHRIFILRQALERFMRGQLVAPSAK